MTRRYTFLLLAFLFSTTGDWIYKLAMPLLIYQLTHSPLHMAAAFGIAHLPYVLFSPFGGLLADRLPRQRILLLGDLGAAVVSGALTMALLLHCSSVFLLYPLIFILASIEPVYHPAFQSIIPSLVSPSSLPKANAGMNTAENLISVIGPLLGGGIIASVGPVAAVCANACSFLLSAAFIAAIPAQQGGTARPQATETPAAALRAGARYIYQSPILRSGVLILAAANFAITLFTANSIYYLSVVLSFSVFHIGLVTAAAGIGAVAGAFAAVRLMPHLQAGVLISACTILEGVSMLALNVTSSVLGTALVYGAVMAFGTVTIITWFTLRQRVVPDHLLGRVVSMTRLVAYSSIPIGAMIGGYLVSFPGSMPRLILASALLRVLIGGLGFLSPLCAR